MEFKSGVIKSEYDSQDYLMKSFLEFKALPPKFDLTKDMTPVRSQGQEGSCVGFAMSVGCREYQEKIDYKDIIELSPRFLYEEAKKISGHSEGTTLKAAVQVAKNIGVCQEAYWPYVPKEIGLASPEAYKNALRHRIKVYARVTNLTELKQAIVDPKIGPVMIGVHVYKQMLSDDTKRDGVVDDPTCCDRSKGGHAICAVGYDDESPYFKTGGHIKCKNSWGEVHGDSGYLYLSYRYIRKNMLDAFSSIDIKGSPHIIKVGHMGIRESANSWI